MPCWPAASADIRSTAFQRLPQKLPRKVPLLLPNSVVISCADLKEGETYTLVAGDTSTSVSLNQK